MKKSVNKIFIAVVLLAMVALIFGIIYFFTKPGTHTGTKQIQIEVIDDNGAVTSYTANTDAEYLSEVFDEIDDLTVSGDDSDYGLFITTVNGLKADYINDKTYWSIVVNGEYGEYGADGQPVTDGDTYSLVFTKSE